MRRVLSNSEPGDWSPGGVGLLEIVALIAGLCLVLCGPASWAAETRSHGPGWRSEALPVPSTGRTGFTRVAPAQTGVLFTNALAIDRSITNHVLLNGSGVAAGDVDGDGRVDLYFCGLDSPNKLYRNLGQWRFEDITESAGVACAELDATGALLADLDGDGDLDLVVNSIAGGTRVFLNDGKGRFTPSPTSPVLNEGQAGSSLAAADMNGNGALDLYVVNYRPMFFFLDKPETRYSVRTVDGQPQVTMIDGRPLTDPEFTNRFVFSVHVADGKVTLAKEELGQEDRLYRNDGKGGFSLVPFTGGAFLDEDGRGLAEPPRDWGLSAMFRDLNGDGMPDLYVCNDFRTPDRIWINDGSGRFRALPRLGIRQTCLSAMGLDVADVNRDGHFDIFVADMLSTEHSKRLSQRIDIRPEALRIGQIDNRPQFSRNMLQLNRGDGTFAEIAQFSGLQASDWTWSPIFLDVDLDGYEDLLLGNGFERDTMSVDMQRNFERLSHQRKLKGLERLKLRRLFPRLATPNLAFRNLDGFKFAEVSTAWGFDTAAISQGMCLADLDNDGDLDLIASNMNESAGLYRNETVAPRVAVRLRGRAPNTRGIGALIEVFGGPVYQSQEMIAGGRYASSDDALRTFAAGSLTQDLRITVSWRSGKRSSVTGVKPNRLYEIDEPDAGQGLCANPAPDPEQPLPTALFQDVSALLAHRHHQEPFDDFTRQPLLPYKLSQAGPGVCWFDLDQDGWEDLVIGSGGGGKPAVYRNDQQGGFEPMPGPGWNLAATRDQTAVLAWHTTNGAALLVGTSSYQDGQPERAAVMQLQGQAQSAREIIPGGASSTGPLALADVDGDGALDLFVGGRVIPGRYPEPASSRLFLNRDGAFQPDDANARAFEKIGLVSGAVFSDLDGDGDPDLVLACEWGPVRVFTNEGGRFIEATRQLGLDKFTGWWNGVSVGDFDNDGRLDIVASNWGANSRHEMFRQEPLRLYYGDFNGDGGVQLIEAYVDPQLRMIVPWRRLDDITRGMPFLHATFETFEQFSRASIEEILGDRITKAAVLEANWLESTVFLNRGDHFEAVPLPMEAQLAPAFAVCVGDLDGDGNEDLFLSQNFFAVQAEMSRYDAGRSLWLRGNGRGGFEAVSGQESGLLVYGEQRGAALCDFDADGRLDVAVSQNGAPTKLFRNQGARPGLRVRLKGPPRNPDGVGAVIRMIYGDRKGPAREVHAGSGYWSQQGAVHVMAAHETPTAIEVRWPGRQAWQAEWPAGALQIEAGHQGSVRPVPQPGSRMSTNQ